ncbi:MAG TPA: hypothetical protein VN514_07130 [Ignavibacteria bacterium]|nr:hypothetical protein [Ignavibacteria bacterium]
MIKILRKGYLILKCKECHKEHSFEGRDLVFEPYGSDASGKKYLCVTEFFCSCDTKIKSEITIIESPIGTIKEILKESKNAEITRMPDISILSL